MKHLIYTLFLLLLFVATAHAQSQFEWQINYETEVFETVDTLPEYVWGEDSLQNFFAVRQEEVLDEDGKKVTGMVAVEFIVDRYGDVRSPAIRKSQDERLNREALSIVAELHGYKPGRKNGQNVNTRMTAVVHFR